MSIPLIIVQARMESTRLPGKVLKSMCGAPMLTWQLARIRRLQTPYQLIVASPDTPANHRLAEVLGQYGYVCALVPGDPDDVLTRFLVLVDRYQPQVVVRLTGDCPLIDPQVLEGMLTMCGEPGSMCDYLGLAPEWPEGIDAEVISAAALRRAAGLTQWPSEREHVTMRLWRAPEDFLCKTYPCPEAWGHYQWSVDTEEDFRYVEQLLAAAMERVGLAYTTRELCQVVDASPAIRAAMDRRGPRNPAFMAQVAQEGNTPLSWEAFRYGR